jgi:hypothetical protein
MTALPLADRGRYMADDQHSNQAGGGGLPQLDSTMILYLTFAG